MLADETNVFLTNKSLKRLDNITVIFIIIARPLWRHYYVNTQALIIVVDSQDHYRIKEAGEELTRMLNEDELKDIPVLVLANKQDLKNVLNGEQVSKEMNLESYKDRETKCFETSAITGQGLSDAFDWLSNVIVNNQKSER